MDGLGGLIPFDMTAHATATCVPYNFSKASLNTNLWGWQGWYVLADIFVLFVVLYREWVPIEFAMVAAVLMLAAAQIITVNEMIAGFGNSGVLAIAVLLIVAEGLASTGAIDYFLGKALGKPDSFGIAFMRLMIPSTFIACWISSAALLALLIPVVMRWCKQMGIPPSQIMMPLCYAIHLGGTGTMIGTTTNLVISGLAQQYYCTKMGIFELTAVGAPVAICGLGFLLLLTPICLPDKAEYERRISAVPVKKYKKKISWKEWFISLKNMKFSCNNCALPSCCNCCKKKDAKGKGLEDNQSDAASIPAGNEFLYDAKIPKESELDHCTVEEAGLRGLEGLFLISVTRGGILHHAVGHDFELHESDMLTFAGNHDAFLPFCTEKGLTPVVRDESTDENPLTSYTMEVIIRNESSLVGKTMKEVSFRTRYNASVLAITRAGERLTSAKLGQEKLKVGDILVLIVSEKFDWKSELVVKDLKPRFEKSVTSRTISQASTMDSVGDFTFESKKKSGDYMYSMIVSRKQRLKLAETLHNKTVEQGGLRDVPGARVIAVTRDGATDRCIGPNYILKAGDVVWFSGDRETITSLRRIPGLEDSAESQVKKLGVSAHHRRLVEVVVSLNSDLIYKSVREARFRNRFNAAIVAVQRQGVRLIEQIGDLELEPGDVLIIDAGPEFQKRFKNDPNFLVISEVDHSEPPRLDRFYIAFVCAVAMVSLTAAFQVDILITALFATGIMLATGVMTRERTHRAVDWKIIITVAAGFGLSTAMTNTNVATVIGVALTDLAIATGTGTVGVITVILVFTEILCALITAKAGATLMFPIAATAAFRLNIPSSTMIFALMLGASDFTTPQGHQTNLMVYVPGAYVFVDYQKLGIPLELLLNVVQVTFLVWIQYWYFNLIGSILLCFVCFLINHRRVEKRPWSELKPSCSCCRRNKNNTSQLPQENEAVVDENGTTAASFNNEIQQI